jgi:hypothetical protein
LDKETSVLPVCANCGKVRVHEMWYERKELVEQYKNNLSHGICPPCTRVLYPKIADKILGTADSTKVT